MLTLCYKAGPVLDALGEILAGAIEMISNLLIPRKECLGNMCLHKL